MKRLLILTFIFFKSSSAFNQSCSPTFKEIFDFQVGDFFRYEDGVTSYAADWSKTLTFESYTIKERKEYSDTLVYVRSGKGKEFLYYYCYPSPGDDCHDIWELYSSGTYPINDTIVYIDSINHFLNKCSDSLISVFPFTRCCDTIYTKILVEQNDSILKKSVGGENNFYYYDTLLKKWDSLFVGLDPDSYRYNFGEVYAKGLGLIEQYYSGFEVGSSKSLLGYIKGTDTFGIITSIPENILFKSDFLIYPNPVSNNLYVQIDNSITLINIYNMNGILINSVPVKNLNNNTITIDVKDFKSGLYFIELRGKIRSMGKFEKL